MCKSRDNRNISLTVHARTSDFFTTFSSTAFVSWIK
jgi:hypothetical protein